MASSKHTPDTTSTGRRLAFIGTGNMNGAILRGILAGGFDPRSITATVRGSEKAERLAADTGVRSLATTVDETANQQAVAAADIVFVGVKPVGIQDACRDIAASLPAQAVVVSVAAAVTISMIEEALPQGQPVVRAMPNTPMTVGKGVVALAGGTSTGEKDLEAVSALLSETGMVRIVSEDQIDAVSAVSGSGPAYAFYLAEAMAAAGEELGLEAGLARDLARATVAGAGVMLDEPDADPSALRTAVTSPGGTTQAALEGFDAAGVRAGIGSGVKAATERAAEITRELAG
ncbi:MAG: pyrroline-5-carboxylate reductase [Arthrobacter sp.]|uniref:pyrroline-5-carboxylate reductase n=1 Tax=unclassified Arthrobacter TaxID=235627 RepID=UPI002652DDF2|nr:pyrroline-5-carboxylate reductase [Micrococcaceae bacterium]MDN5812074.1 pyrroline-5-carboxylate reductase [Micrococcaceae bacterium]MDN5823135.1 pyrroline-5-carboxylate reductase [Micrococcaceae bacterium]MDN5878520.1 pyrroline-5-carboxylate reductase [Micrococcaceae bacterium]MDN5885424.1 pyrroline-5-carboxylate reductase [Micrococcaceae bacterium]